MADDEISWTEEQQRNTLAAAEILKSYYKGDPAASGPKTVKVVDEIGVEGVLAGYNNVCAILVHQISLLTRHDALQIVYDVEEHARNVNIIE